MDIQSSLHTKGFSRVIDLSRAEKEGKYFEGTGALVLDRINGVAYVNLSERADKKIAEHWAEKLGYKVRILANFKLVSVQSVAMFACNFLVGRTMYFSFRD